MAFVIHIKVVHRDTFHGGDNIDFYFREDYSPICSAKSSYLRIYKSSPCSR